jgi:ABC-type glycerol-3-phosphate transport system substrate-binding protein
MRFNPDKLLLFAAAFVLAVLLAMRWSSYKTGEKPQRKTTVNLVFSQYWEPELGGGVLAGIIGEFEAQNENVKVTLDTRTYNDIKLLLIAMDSAGNDGRPAADVIGFDPLFLDGLADEALFIKSEPVTAFLHPLFYNTVSLQNAGFDRPPKNRSDVLAICGKLAETGSLGIAFSNNPYYSVLPWVLASGIALADIDTLDKPVDFAAKPVVETLAFIGELRQHGFAPPPFTESPEQIIEDFIDGKTAMLAGSTADINKIRARSPAGFSFGITAFPPPDAFFGRSIVSLSTWQAAVPEGSAHREEALNLLAFLAEKRSRIAFAAGAVPGDIFEDEQGGAYLADAERLDADPLFAKARDIYEGGEGVAEHSIRMAALFP